jgi:hypothetical protein
MTESDRSDRDRKTPREALPVDAARWTEPDPA